MNNILLTSPLFSRLSENKANELYSKMTSLTLNKDDVLFYENDLADSMYVIQNGKLKVVTKQKEKQETLLAILSDGEICGELALFSHPSKRVATATALTTTKVFSLTANDMWSWIDSNPTVARVFLEALAQRLLRANETLSDLVFTDVQGRVAKTLIELAKKFGIQTDNRIQIAHGMTQEELAQLVGTSRETMNKTLTIFSAHKWIEISPRTVHILDIEKLKTRAG